MTREYSTNDPEAESKSEIAFNQWNEIVRTYQQTKAMTPKMVAKTFEILKTLFLIIRKYEVTIIEEQKKRDKYFDKWMNLVNKKKGRE